MTAARIRTEVIKENRAYSIWWLIGRTMERKERSVTDAVARAAKIAARYMNLSTPELTEAAKHVHKNMSVRYGPGDNVYDAVMHHHVVPELISRLEELELRNQELEKMNASKP